MRLCDTNLLLEAYFGKKHAPNKDSCMLDRFNPAGIDDLGTHWEPRPSSRM
jgi:hypothetical protein